MQLVEVEGANMWVMEETGSPSSDTSPTIHLRKRVHAQQSSACSSKRNAKSPRMIGMHIIEPMCVLESDVMYAVTYVTL